MKVYYATAKECTEFDTAIASLNKLSLQIEETQRLFVMAGVGTFGTKKENEMLIKLDRKILKLKDRLYRRAEIAMRNSAGKL